MGSQAEYNQLCNEKAQAEREKREAEGRRDNLKKKIERLEKAKKKLDSYYNSYRSTKNEDESDVREKYTWKGDTYNTFADMGDSLITNNRIYLNSIDRVRDAVNTKKTKLENELLEEEGLIGLLAARINDLVNAIENFVNDLASAAEDGWNDLKDGVKDGFNYVSNILPW